MVCNENTAVIVSVTTLKDVSDGIVDKVNYKTDS